MNAVTVALIRSIFTFSGGFKVGFWWLRWFFLVVTLVWFRDERNTYRKVLRPIWAFQVMAY